MKRCYKCMEIKKESLFSKDRSKKDGRSLECKKCAIKRAIVYNFKNRNKVRDANRKIRWQKQGINITLEEYDRRFLQQKGICAICKEF